MSATARPVVETIGANELAGELSKLLRLGLPATERSAGDVLPHLKSVLARAVHPEEALSRLDALNELLPRLIGKLEDETYREAAQILFGLAPGTRRSRLTDRRRQAADLLAYNVDHFRTRIEPEMMRAVAEQVQRDLLRYKSRVKRAANTLEPTGDTPRLAVEHLTAEEELISRIWQHVYGLRAELIAHLRLQDQAGYQGQAEDHRQAALRQHEDLRRLIQEYVQTYGKQLIQHGEAEFAVERLERLAGWRE
ncbi:MAG: hypothetical protein M3443_01045 [Actinomycetota bacterium]|nr:hypothetical protein [Actinomycetota bacterium]